MRIWEFRLLIFYLVDVDATEDKDRWEKKEEYNWDKWSWIKKKKKKSTVTRRLTISNEEKMLWLEMSNEWIVMVWNWCGIERGTDSYLQT